MLGALKHPMTIGAGTGGLAGAGIGAASADEGMRGRGALIGGASGALLGAGLGALSHTGNMISMSEAERAVHVARNEAFDMGVDAAKRGLV